jgi:hypothetical protein
MQIEAEFADREANEPRVRAEGVVEQREQETLKNCWCLDRFRLRESPAAS